MELEAATSRDPYPVIRLASAAPGHIFSYVSEDAGRSGQRVPQGDRAADIPWFIPAKSPSSINCPSEILRSLRSPHGIILVTGSRDGKSTTSHAMTTISIPIKPEHHPRDPIESSTIATLPVVAARARTPPPAFAEASARLCAKIPTSSWLVNARCRAVPGHDSAETRHLVLCTLHTTGAVRHCRVIDALPLQ